MVEIKHSGKSMDQRVADRLKTSGSPEADHHVVHGTGPTRTHTHIHSTGHVLQRGDDAKGQDIYGQDRGPANRDGEI